MAKETFRDTFAAANAPDDMDLHCRASYGDAIQAQEIAFPAGSRCCASAVESWSGSHK